MPGGIGYDFMPWDEERRERKPGLMGLVDSPNAWDNYLKSIAATQDRYGVSTTQAKPPQPSGYRPDLALNRLRRAQSLSPTTIQDLMRRGEMA